MTTTSDQGRHELLPKPTRIDWNIILEIGKALTSNLEVQTVLEVIMQKVELLLKPKVWSLLLADEETGDLRFEIAESSVGERLKGVRLKRGEGIAGWVALHGTPVLSLDVSQDKRFSRHLDDMLSFTTRSIICVPLMVREQTRGVIQVINSLEEGEFTDADLTILGAIADFAAIAIENSRNYGKLRDLVIIDDLTGLFNANHFHTLLDSEIDRARRYRSEFSLVFLDLDHFKGVNDTHGHLVGSRLLSEFGHLLKRHSRSSDLGARYGGDEFVILLPNTSKKGALAMVANFRNVVAGHTFTSDTGDRIEVTASYGIATFPEDANTKHALIQAADQAMYRIKETTRDGVMAFEK